MKETIRRYVNYFLIVAVLGSWLALFIFGRDSLMENGIRSLKYFTILSNLMCGGSAAAWLISSGRNGRASDRVEHVKFAAAAAVMLTFTTVAVFLGPIYGYKSMFSSFNLFLHMITPLTAAAEIVFLSDAEYSIRDNNYALLPPLIYGSFYLGNIIINGRGEWPDTNDWYMFLAWGYPVGILIFGCAAMVTWLLALGMRKLHDSLNNKAVIDK